MGHCWHHLNRKPLLPRPVRAGSPFGFELLFKTRAPQGFLCCLKTWGLEKSALSLVFLLHQSLLSLLSFESFSEGLVSSIHLTLGGREIPSLCSLRLRPGWGHPGLESWWQIRVLGFQLQNLSLPAPRGCQILSTAHCPDSCAAHETNPSVSKHAGTLLEPSDTRREHREIGGGGE